MIKNLQDHQDDDHTCKEISRTKIICIWLDLFVILGQRIFGKDARPGKSGILGFYSGEQERGGVHHFAPSTKLAIGYADQPTKAQIMFCIHNYLG